MKTTNTFEFETTKNEHIYRFLLPVGVPLGEAYDACIEIASELVNIIRQQVEKSKPVQTEEKEDKIVKLNKQKEE